MTIDATFWVAVSFFIFFGILIYLKVPQKINNSLTDQINKMKNELDEAEKLKVEAKKETREIINLAKKDSEKNILEKTKRFHQIIENKKKNTELKIIQMKENALKDIKNISVKVCIKTAEHLIKNSIDKEKLEKFHAKSLEQTKISLNRAKI